MEEDKPKVNLKQHQRFKREIPWALIRKIVIVGVLGGMIYYLANNIPTEEVDIIDGVEVEVE